MAKGSKKGKTPHYVKINEELCNGCVLCMKVCPAKAIRVKANELARIEGECIDCGECIKACPRGAIKAVTTVDSGRLDKSKAIVGVSPVLFTQFGEDVTPDDVISALKRLGFLDVYDQSDALEMFNMAVGLYIEESKNKPAAPRPLISPVCPVVTRLIAQRFPSLLSHIPPLLTPRELAAREAKRRAIQEYGLKENELKVYHITPCSAKMIAIKNPILVDQSYLDGAIGIKDIYEPLLGELKSMNLSKRSNHPIRAIIGWARSGGEIAGMEGGNFLGVSGMQETIRYLEKIEMGLLDDIDYVEFRVTPEGCIGGALTVTDKYQAKHTISRLTQKYGLEKKVKTDYVKEQYDKGWFFFQGGVKMPPKSSDISLSEAIERQLKVEEVKEMLPGKECGICGCPDCQTFAEDVADGRVFVEQCILLDREKGKGENK